MSRQFNPAAYAYNNMDIENLPKEEEKSDTGLLSRKPMMQKSGMDYSSPALRVAKQLEVIRKHRNEVNATE